MDNNTLKNIFKFLEDKGEYKAPFKWKLENNIPLSKEDLIVDDDLYLFDSKITSLPKGLEVKYNLYLAHSDIETLPKGLKVGAGLNIGNTKLTEYTDEELRNMIAPGFIKGRIYR